MLASLPMGDIDGALLEIDFEINELNADGFILPTNYQGIYLGSTIEGVVRPLFFASTT